MNITTETLNAKKSRGVIVVAMLASTLLAGSATAAENSDGTRTNRKRDRYLLLDSRIIESTENAKLTLGTVRKDRNNPLFSEDKPWEPRFDNLYPNVIYDEEDRLYKCWYHPFIKDDNVKEVPREKYSSIPYDPGKARGVGVCYAFSKDGIHWEKPELGMVEFGGNKKNNIVRDGGPHGLGVFKDLHELEPARRYKMFNWNAQVAFSPDGLHWSPFISTPHMEPGLSHVFWAPDLGKYVCVQRKATPTGRHIHRTESVDCVHWTREKIILESVPGRQTHDIVAFPIGGVYVGLLGLFDTVSTHQHVEVVWSPDSLEWHWISTGTPLIANGQSTDAYDWGCIFASPPIVRNNEILLYYAASNGLHFDWRDGFLCLARLRPDGFAGYQQVKWKQGSVAAAAITTKPVLAVADSLRLSADVAISGYVKVVLLDKENKKLAESELISNTVTDAELQWPEGFSFSILKGSKIRLRFELRDAKLYSFSFSD